MPSKNSAYTNGIVFAFFFSIPQVVSFVCMPFSVFSPIWGLYMMGVLALGISQNSIYNRKEMRLPLSMLALFIVGSCLSLLAGVQLGGVANKLAIVLVAFIGFAFISHHKIDPRIFNIIIPVLYIFFYFVYFRYDEFYRNSVNGDLFGHSSSNTISMTLTIIWYLYYVISKAEKRNNNVMLLLFSLVNIAFIVIQGSRAGIVVAAIEILLGISNMTKKKMRSFVFLLLLVLGVIGFYRFGYFLEDIMDVNQMQGMESYEENTRFFAQAAFFSQMNAKHFLFGFPPDNEFGDLNRTFNAFLDLWSRFGILPLAGIFVLMIRRIIKRKYFVLSLLDFFPWLFYSLVESLWGGTLWDISFYIVLFYSYDETISKDKTVSKNIEASIVSASCTSDGQIV